MSGNSRAPRASHLDENNLGGFCLKPQWVRQTLGIQIEIVRKIAHRFEVLPKRWASERTFAWLNHDRRLSKDFERRTDSAKAMNHLGKIRRMLARLTVNHTHFLNSILSERGLLMQKPLVFISHHSGDSDLAAAFAQLLEDCSHNGESPLVDVFFASAKDRSHGIEYGHQWYPLILQKFRDSAAIVCLLTPKSIERSWILFEAGYASGARSQRI